MQDKTHLRRQLRRRRSALTHDQRRRAALKVRHHLIAAGILRRGRRIGIYIAAGSELSLASLIPEAQRRGARLFAPLIPRQGRIMHFGELGKPGGRWRRNRFGIVEYYARPCVPLRHLHTVLLPLLGFDRKGGRLGQGGGFYDATLANCSHAMRPRRIGIAFACQLVTPQLSLEAHDQRLDGVITEQGQLRFPARRLQAAKEPDKPSGQR